MSFKEEPRKKVSLYIHVLGKIDFLLNHLKIPVTYVKKFLFKIDIFKKLIKIHLVYLPILVVKPSYKQVLKTTATAITPPTLFVQKLVCSFILLFLL